MKAYVLHGVNKIHLEEIPIPSPGEGEVLIEVQAMGICGSDIPRIYRTGTYSYPLIPGHEFSGIVSETGRDVDKSWLGKRVGIFPLIPCRSCAPCQNRQYELCRSYSYLGSRTAGGFAQYVTVPVWNLLELPEPVSFEQAAMLEPMAVAMHAVKRADLKNGQTTAICGLGTIGLLLYQILTEMGLEEIFLIGNKSYQEELAGNLGASRAYFCNKQEKDVDQWLEEAMPSGADVFFDCVGTEESVELALRHTAPGGTGMLVGNPASDMRLDRQTYWKILRNQLTIKGIWNSSFTHEDTDDWHTCLDLIARKRVAPQKLISHRLPFDRLGEGTELMRDKRENYTKVMTVL